MSIFWCISMLNNVKSYKKINEKAQMANFSVFAKRSQLRNDLFATGETKKQFYLKF